MSLPELPPLPKPSDYGYRDENGNWNVQFAFHDAQMRAYGLLCLRQGWKMGAMMCANSCMELADAAERVGSSQREGGCFDCHEECVRIASDSPK